MLKATITIILLSITLFLLGQSEGFCVTKDIYPTDPAPCSIEGNGIQQEGWLIQIGVYKNFITPKENTFMYFFKPYFVYYIDQNYNEWDAKTNALLLQANGYCDAIAVKNPVPTYLFQHKRTSL